MRSVVSGQIGRRRSDCRKRRHVQYPIGALRQNLRGRPKKILISEKKPDLPGSFEIGQTNGFDDGDSAAYAFPKQFSRSAMNSISKQSPSFQQHVIRCVQRLSTCKDSPGAPVARNGRCCCANQIDESMNKLISRLTPPGSLEMCPECLSDHSILIVCNVGVFSVTEVENAAHVCRFLQISEVAPDEPPWILGKSDSEFARALSGR
jgi:hypothetical protein